MGAPTARRLVHRWRDWIDIRTKFAYHSRWIASAWANARRTVEENNLTANEQPDGLLIDLIETILGIGAVITSLVVVMGLLFIMVTRANPGLGGESAAASAPTTAPADAQARPDEEGQPEAPSEDVLALGAEVFATQGCGACHTLEGVSQGMVGPSLTDLPAVAPDRAAATGVADAAAYVRRSIVAPNDYIVDECPTGPCPPGTMPANFGQVLSNEELDALVQYLLAR
jgi:mono/diheme cytochrome c family protein